MPIMVNLDVVMAQRKMTLSQLSEQVDITLANLSILKNNKAKAVRFSTLEAICAALDCQPGDILVYVPEVSLAEGQLEKENRRWTRNLLCRRQGRVSAPKIRHSR